MAVALAPAFAQQTQPQKPAGSAAIQPESAMKTPAVNQTGKDEKNLHAKPGPDVKATAPPASSAKPMGGAKTEKPAPAKTGTDVKNEGVSGKSGQDIKAGSAPAKTESGLKNEQGAKAGQGANIKSDSPVKPDSSTKALTTPKHHAKKSSGKVSSKMRAKTRVSNQDMRRKFGKSEGGASSAGK